jgi:type II secretory pathway pseudopilin PulG
MHGTSRQQAHRRARAAAPAGAGFTLVEVLVTTALLVIVLGLLLYYPIMSSFSYFRSASARADAQSAARIALDAMARELTEAMYVQLDMYDSSMMAFVPPLRVDRDDPNSDIVMPPRPDWERAVRYWRALHDPTMNYSTGDHLRTGNTYYLARTVIARLPGDPEDVLAPFATDDPWNRWNDDWAAELSGYEVKGKDNWSAINRMVHTDVDWRAATGSVARRNATLQPGFPYLYVQYLADRGEVGRAEATRLYRGSAVALTPNALDYDVTRLEFTPMAVSGEWLRPIPAAGSEDPSVYRAQYPLWRQGTPSTGWTALAESLEVEFPAWARDPFLLIDGYRYRGGELVPTLAIGMFDPDSRTMKVFDLADLEAAVSPGSAVWIYDTDQYYQSSPRTLWRDIDWTGFGVDWTEGSVRFDFPPPEDAYPGDLYSIQGSQLAVSAPLDESPKFDVPLPFWEYRDAGTPDTVLETFVIPDTVEVWTDTDEDTGPDVSMSGVPDRLLTRVGCTPRDYSYQFQLGIEPMIGGLSASVPSYGWLRLPTSFAEGDDPRNHTFWVNFRWHDNGVWGDIDGDGDSEYCWDLVSAYYRTAAILDVSLTVTRSDPSARLDERIAQSANMTRRVKLHNMLRRVRYAED